MTIRVGSCWEDTLETVRAHFGAIARVALLALFVPTVLQGALGLVVRPDGNGARLLAALLGLGVMLAAVWGQLALTRLAIAADGDVPAAARIASRRLPAAIAVAIVLTAALFATALPVFAVLTAAGADWTRMSDANSFGASLAQSRLTAGAGWFLLGYALVLVAALLWLFARLLLVYAVVVEEARILGALRRSIALTRGATWRLIGAIVLFVVVAGVSARATVSVVGVIARLILGAERIVAAMFVAALAGSLVSTVLTTLAIVFVGRAYVQALRGTAVAGVRPLA